MAGPNHRLKHMAQDVAAAKRPTALHATDRLAAILRAYHFTHQYSSRRPFTAEASSSRYQPVGLSYVLAIAFPHYFHLQSRAFLGL
jgi:hypothetical protein